MRRDQIAGSFQGRACFASMLALATCLFYSTAVSPLTINLSRKIPITIKGRMAADETAKTSEAMIVKTTKRLGFKWVRDLPSAQIVRAIVIAISCLLKVALDYHCALQRNVKL